MGYTRFRTLLKILSRLGRWQNDKLTLVANGVRGIRGNADLAIWRLHYEIFLRQGWRYLKADAKADAFVHHCTDGPECPYAYVYARKDLITFFSMFDVEKTEVAYFPLNRYPVLRLFPRRVERLLARHIGWYLFNFLRKPAN